MMRRYHPLKFPENCISTCPTIGSVRPDEYKLLEKCRTYVVSVSMHNTEYIEVEY